MAGGRLTHLRRSPWQAIATWLSSLTSAWTSRGAAVGCRRAGTTGRWTVQFLDRAAAPQVMRGRYTASGCIQASCEEPETAIT